MKKSINYIVALFLTFFIIITCGVLMEGTGGAYPWWQKFYQLPENKVDVVFTGNSHSYCSFSPKIFSDVWEMDVMQMSSNGIDIVPVYYYLKEIFKYQSPHTVIIEGYSFIDRKQWIPENDIKISQANALTSMRWGESRIKGNIEVFGKTQGIKNLFPFMSNHRNWENLDYIETRLRDIIQPQVAYSCEQFAPTSTIMSQETALLYQSMESIEDKWVLDPDQKSYFNEIVTLCNENNAKIILVMAPIYKEWTNHVDYMSRHNQIQLLAEQYQIPFIDYNISEIYDKINLSEEHFRNDGFTTIGNTHLNTEGATIISNDLAKRLYSLVNTP